MFKKFIYLTSIILILNSCSKLLTTKNNQEANSSNDLPNVVVSNNKNLLKRTIYFNTNSFEISNKDSLLIKDDIQNILKSNKKIKITSEGHCDGRGTKSYNFKLGKKRALAVKKLLIESGIKSSKISIVSFGENKPADSGHDENAWAKNRRVEVIIIN